VRADLLSLRVELGAHLPPRKVCTLAAASRPSLIAHTTSDCPRLQSPAAKTPSTLVAYSPYFALKFARWSSSSESCEGMSASGLLKPIARMTRSHGHSRSLPYKRGGEGGCSVAIGLQPKDVCRKRMRGVKKQQKTSISTRRPPSTRMLTVFSAVSLPSVLMKIDGMMYFK